LSNQNHYRPLPIHDLRNAEIRAIATAFDYSEISKILKETLLLILIGFAIAFFTILIQLLTGGKSSEKAEAASAPSIKPSYKTQFSESQNIDKPKTDTSVIFTPAKANDYAQQAAASPSALQTAEPKGLYSPRSNIGWEEYIDERLDSELHRCSSTENDLTLVVIEFNDITTDTMYRQAAEETSTFFSSRDLLFEYGEYGIAIILPGINLDASISKSEKFHQRITGKFPARYKQKSSLHIGLSSRAGRLLNSHRLIFEAKEALNRAKPHPSPSIIAFKNKTKKYRAFISK
jgi:GGDEF domain-containing protein